MSKVPMTQEQVGMVAATTAAILSKEFGPVPHHRIRLYGVPRGGVPVAYLIAGILTGVQLVDTVEEANVIVDDLIDSGKTAREYLMHYPDKMFVALLRKDHSPLLDNCFTGGTVHSDNWIVFPWEGSEEASADDIGLRLLQFIGENPHREGLQETPARFLRAWSEWTSGYNADLAALFKDFGDGAEGYDEAVMVDPIPFYSHCEHHLAAIFGTVHIAYIPNGRIAGLSKFCRLVDAFAKRLQVQERLTVQIADAIASALEPLGVAVVVRARHFCMESRGANKPGVSTTTSALRGTYKTDPATRAEFLSLMKGRD